MEIGFSFMSLGDAQRRSGGLVEFGFVRVPYAISYEAYVATQRPFTPLDPVGFGLLFILEFAVMVAGIGFVLVAVRVTFLLGATPWRSANLAKGIGVFALGGLPILGIWMGRKISARKMLREHNEFLRASFGRLHCRDQRFIEVQDEGVIFGCACKTPLIPWPQLSTLSETESNFVIAAGSEMHIIPKPAFPTEAERTEFRTMLSEKLHQTKTLTARTIEFECRNADWRNARWLLFKAGGWKFQAMMAVSACVGTIMILSFAPAFDDHARFTAPFIAAACIFAAIVLMLVVLLRRKPARYRGLLKVSFAEDAIYVQSPVSEIRIPWHMVTGCIGDKRSLILIQRPFSMLLIPVRSMLRAQGEYIIERLRAKLL